MTLRLFNTLSRSLEEFIPREPGKVGLYTCGPTVYSSPHLGNYRSYIFADTLRRVLQANDLAVHQVINVTDVGHLTSDADEGEDKLEKGAAREGLSVWDVAKKYTAEFFGGCATLNIESPNVIARATEHVPDQIALIKRLIANGHIYETSQALYFDVTTFPTYTALSRQPLDDKRTAARAEVKTDTDKKHPADFALWFKRVGKFQNHTMHWPSPWGDGFPGWHIECSAMSMKYLGEQFDIHTGGIDHIPVHHTNEIAQSEGATNKVPFVRYWLHSEFLVTQAAKMAKSEGNALTLAELERRGIDPLAYRYFILQAHYRSPLAFSWEALAAAQKGLRNLRLRIGLLKGAPKVGCAEFERQFLGALNDDLNTPQALAVLHALLRSQYPDEAKKQSLSVFEKALGLGLDQIPPISVPTETLANVQALIDEREQLRVERAFAEADQLRDEINTRLNTAGFVLEDSDSGPVIAPLR